MTEIILEKVRVFCEKNKSAILTLQSKSYEFFFIAPIDNLKCHQDLGRQV